ncbi:hypothetical protein [Brumimicrobium salinarum]|nr:hypothetical protein [Brumimicrobium salinarum]
MKEKFNIAFLLFGLICILSFTVHGQKLEQLEEQLKTAKSENQQKLVVETYILLGDYYVNEEDKINKGQRFYRRGARRNKNNEFQDLAILYNRQYARSYVLQNNYEDAATHYEEALRIAKSNKLKNYTRNLTEEIRQFNEKRKKIELAKKELDNLKSLKDDEAIAYIEDKNSKEAQETEQFFYKINKLSRENQLQQIKIKFTENELEKKDLKIELLDQYNKAKEAEIKKNEAELALKNAEIEKRRLETQRQRNVILFFVVVSVLLIFIGLIIVRNYIKQKN